MEARLDLFAEELEGVHDAVMRDFSAAIEFGEDAVEADLLLHFLEPCGETVGGAADDLGRQRLVESQRLQPLDPPQPVDRNLTAGAPGRVATELGLISEKAHQTVLEFGAGALLSVGEIGRDARSEERR